MFKRHRQCRSGELKHPTRALSGRAEDVLPVIGHLQTTHDAHSSSRTVVSIYNLSPSKPFRTTLFTIMYDSI